MEVGRKRGYLMVVGRSGVWKVGEGGRWLKMESWNTGIDFVKVKGVKVVWEQHN